MFLLFGASTKFTQLLTVVFACHFCGQTVPQRVLKRVLRFSVFFIPLFPLSTRYFNECTNCGGTTDLSREQVEHARQNAIRPA